MLPIFVPGPLRGRACRVVGPAFLLLALLRSDGAHAANGPQVDLEGFYAHWAAAVAPLMAPAEAEVFERLDNDVERDLFIRSFWRVRDTGAARRWAERYREASLAFDDPAGARARAMLTVGVPDRVHVYGGCRGIVRPLRIWWLNAHQASDLAGEPRDGLYLVFKRSDTAFTADESDPFELWSPSTGIGGLAENDAPGSRRTVEHIIEYSRERRCFRTGDQEAEVLRRALPNAVEAAQIEAWAAALRGDGAWTETFVESLRGGRLSLAAQEVSVGFLGRDGSQTLVLGRVEVPASALDRDGDGRLFERLVLRGDARLGAFASDRFEMVFQLAGHVPADGTVRLDFYRRLRPGRHVLRLRLEDEAGLPVLRRDLSLDVPLPDEPVDEATRRHTDALTRRRAGRLLTLPSLEILPLEENAVGRVEIEVATHGGPVANVVLLLDGRPVATDDKAPFRAVVELGAEPIAHHVEAVAYDPTGLEIARAERRLDPAHRPFRVHLEPPSWSAVGAAAARGDEVEVRVHVDLPEGRRLQDLEAALDGRFLHRFDVTVTPPFRLTLPASRLAAARFLGAAGSLDDGLRKEDVVVLDPALAHSADVRWVEVFTTVEDAGGRPVTGLSADAFRVLENDQPQELTDFDLVTNRPIRAVLAMDTSSSMRGRLDAAVDGARRFFSTVMTDKDSAALMTFNHDLHLVAPWTSDVDALHLAASGLVPRGGTRLNDALVFAAGYFSAEPGRRALILLSDGHDVESRYTFDAAMEQILPAGITVYPILLAVDDKTTREQLERLAALSGGRAFSIRRAEELGAVYERIEQDLRNQYLLVYASSSGARDRTFRRIEVQVDGPELRARSIRGYYP